LTIDPAPLERVEARNALSVEILTEEPDKVVALLGLPIGAGGLAVESLVFMVAHEANALGLLSTLGAEGEARTIDSHASFYPCQRGSFLRAEARPIHVDSRVATWRAKVYFTGNADSGEEKDCAAEVTETQIRVPSEEASGGSVAPPADNLADSVAAETLEAAGAVETAPRRRGDVARQRLDQIFKGAFKVISKKGYGSATIREIAAAAKIPIPTMYLYVKTKEDLLYLMTKEYLSKLVKDFEESLSESSSSAAVLERAVVQYIAYCNSQRRLINLVYREGKWLTPQNRAKIFKLDLSFVAIWKRIVEHGIETGEFQVKNPELAANHIYFLCTAWALRYWNLSRFGEAAVRESMLEFIMRGVKAESGAPPPTIRTGHRF
jgi:AcrR family transcriptional regulator/acyl-coenzyme A thioesterase PaaI-like protein